jgi:hypothetical protein
LIACGKEILRKFSDLRGAYKIKLKKVNKKRTVTVRRVIILLNISKHPLLICLHCSSVENSEGGGNGDGGDSCADPCQEFKQGFLGVSRTVYPQ